MQSRFSPMKTPPLVAALLFSLAPACSNDPTGTWLLSIQAQADDTTCTEEITHNFTDAQEYADDADEDQYSSQQASEQSDWLTFAQITVEDKDHALLVVGGEAFPGYSSGGDTWVFSWVETETGSRVDQHPAGYDYSEDSYDEFTSTWTMSLSGKTITGTLIEDQYNDIIYSESDTWTEEVAAELGISGQIPAGSYLEVELQGPSTSVWQAASNGYDSEDCDNIFCELRVQDTCTGSRTVNGTLTDYDDQTAYDAIKDSQQAPGID